MSNDSKYFHLDLTSVIKITRSLDSELCQSSRWKLETIWIHIFHMPEMKCWHHPWISARWNNKRPTNTLKVRPNLNRNSNFYVLKKFSNQNIQINPDLWTSKTSLSWEIFFADAFVLDMTRTLKIIWKSLNIFMAYQMFYVLSFPWSDGGGEVLTRTFEVFVQGFTIDCQEEGKNHNSSCSVFN